MFNVEIGTPGKLFLVTSTGGITATCSNVTASYTGVSAATASSAVGKATPSKVCVTHFSGTCSTSSLWTIESPSGTVLWQKYLPSLTNLSENFDPPLAFSAIGGSVLFKSTPSTSAIQQVNGGGFEVAAGA